MEKHYRVVDVKEDVIEYYIKQSENELGETEYEIRTSKNPAWADHAQNEVKITITDTGSGMKIKPRLDKNVDYGTYTELYILMQFIASVDKNLSNTYHVFSCDNPLAIIN